MLFHFFAGEVLLFRDLTHFMIPQQIFNARGTGQRTSA